MKPSELKVYLQILKSKVKTSPYKEVEISPTQIKVRGEKNNPDTLFILNLTDKVNGDGIYSPEALDLLMLDLNANISAYRKADYSGWQVADFHVDDDMLFDKEAIACLSEAVGYVSKDTFRPALCRVHFKNGDLFATDGYRAYVNPTGELHRQFNLSPSTVAIVKKCAKYGVWHCAIGHTKWSDNTNMVFNGAFAIFEKGVDFATVPDMRKLIESKDMEADTVVKIPYGQVKEVLTSWNCKCATDLTFDIDEQYRQGESGEKALTMTLGGMLLPLRAFTDRIASPSLKGTIRILMPRVAEGHYLSIDPQLLKAFPIGKDGSIRLAFKEGLKSILLVV